MRTSLSSGVLSAVLAAAVLAPGCRTMNRSRDRVTADQIPFETVDQPSRIARTTAPVAETPVAEKPVVAPVVDPVDVTAPDLDAPVVAPPAKPAVVPPAKPAKTKTPPAKDVMAPPATVEPVTAKRPPIDTTPYEAKVVKSADEVGKPGSYVERVIPENGGDQPVQITTADGLSGSTGRHVPAPAPEPEPVPVVKPAPADSGWYVVQAGDILGRIAQKHGVSRQAILDANPSITDPNKLKIGQKLKIPPRGTGITDKPKTAKKAAAAPAKAKKSLPAKDGYTVYTVKKGDILGRIAIANKTTQKAILEANGLADANKIREGQQLYIPAPGTKAESAGEAAPKTAEKKAKGGKTVKVIEDPAAADESTEDILKSLGM